MRRALVAAVVLVVLPACGPDAAGTGDAGADAGAVADGGAPTDAGTVSDGGTGWDGHLRVMAGNLTSGNDQSYLDPGIRIFEGLHPDVALIQEFNVGGDTAQEIRTFVDTAFGPGYAYYRESDNEQIPNGIASRFPIVASGEWTDPNVSNRDFAWAHIDLPGPTDLWAVSVHLLTKPASAREAQARDLVADIRANVPAGAYLVVGGDFNTGSRTETCLSTLGQVVVTTGTWPADQAGNGNTNASRAKPYDWVATGTGLAAWQVPTVVGPDTFPDGLVFDSRVFTPLSAVSPVEQSDSGAPSMQHMGVVKDFVVPH